MLVDTFAVLDRCMSFPLVGHVDAHPPSRISPEPLGNRCGTVEESVRNLCGTCAGPFECTWFERTRPRAQVEVHEGRELQDFGGPVVTRGVQSPVGLR